MMFDNVLQVCQSLIPDSGVGNIICDIAELLEGHQIDNEIFTLEQWNRRRTVHPRLRSVADIERYITPKTLIIFHFSAPSPLTYIIPDLKCPKVLLYHNITPPEFFESYAPHLSNCLKSGITETIFMARLLPYAWGDSEYNCTQLEQMGYERTAVANPPYDFDRFARVTPSNRVVKPEGITNILFVGRIAPNKRQEDIIRSFYYYHKINPNSALTLAGSHEGFESYRSELVKLAGDLDVPVKFTGGIPLNELVAHYRNADLFLCMSEHEGFCLPLIEAMYFGVPVIAFDSSAVTETTGDGGIIFHQKHFPSVAHLMDRVLSDAELLGRMKAAGRERAMYFSKEKSSIRLMKLIEDHALELGI